VSGISSYVRSALVSTPLGSDPGFVSGPPPQRERNHTEGSFGCQPLSARFLGEPASPMPRPLNAQDFRPPAPVDETHGPGASPHRAPGSKAAPDAGHEPARTAQTDVPTGSMEVPWGSANRGLDPGAIAPGVGNENRRPRVAAGGGEGEGEELSGKEGMSWPELSTGWRAPRREVRKLFPRADEKPKRKSKGDAVRITAREPEAFPPCPPSVGRRTVTRQSPRWGDLEINQESF